MPYQDIQKGIEEAKRKALEIQQGINALTPPTVTASLNSQVIQNNSTATLPAPTPTTPTTPTTPADTTWSDKAKSYINSLLGLQAQDTGQEAYSQQQLEQWGAIENRLQLESEGRGRTVGGLAPLTTSALRQNQIQRADITSKVLSLQSEYAMNAGDLVTAKETAKRAVDLKYKPIEESINNFTKQLATIMPFLNAEEKARADALTLQNEAKKTELATKKAQQTALVNDANQAKDSLSASKALALDPSDPQFNAKLAEIQRTLKIKDENVWGNPYTLGGDLVQRNSVTGEIRTAVNVSKGTSTTPANILAGLKPEQQKDPFFQLLANSVGGKPLTDTSIQSLTKGINVLGQLGVLQTNVKDTNTGPILGLFRGANPWDTNAQTIKAQLNAIVPNLARGIYGEVGVLTDNDIKTYAKTLPNLTSTEDVRNAVLGVTLDLIGKSIKNTLQVNAAAGRDVSGFVDLYTEMQSTRESIFSQIPGYKGASTPSLSSLGITPDEQNLFQSVVGVSSSTSQTTSGGFFSNIWKALTGN